MGEGFVIVPRRRRRPLYRVVRALILAVIVIGLTLTSVNCAAGYLVRRTDAHVPRNPETGIMLGAEARDLGPKDAPGAAIFVHGFIGAGDNFDGLPDAVAEQGWRVRVMRLPGHGTSPIDFEHTSENELIEAVRDEVLAMRAEHEQVVLIGHSMGSALSAIVASRQPVDGLVLGAPYFGVTQKWYYLLPVETWVRLTSPFVDWLYKGQFFMRVNKPGVKDNITSYRWVGMESTQTLMRIGHIARDPDLLERIACPVLMIQSHKDEAADPEASHRAFEHIGSESKELLWLERSDHIVFWDYEADKVETAVCAFLQSLQTNETEMQTSESNAEVKEPS